MKSIIIIRFLVLALFLACLTLPTAQAQNGAISPSIGITPPKIIEAVPAGKTTQLIVKLRNYGANALPLSASLSDFEDTQGNGQPVFTDEIGPRSAKTWLKLPKPDVIVDSGQTTEIVINVSPPADAAPGGYHAAVIFQAQLPSYYFDLDANARILPAVSSLLFLTIAGDKVPTVTDLSINQLQVPNFVVSSPISVVGTITNPSSFFIQTDATASLKNSFGGSAKTDQLGQLIILPNGDRKLVGAFTGRLAPGIYTASVQLKQGDKVLVASAKFVALPWPYLVGLILISIAALIIAGRRRFAKAMKVLAGQDTPERRRSRPIIR